VHKLNNYAYVKNSDGLMAVSETIHAFWVVGGSADLRQRKWSGDVSGVLGYPDGVEAYVM